MQGHPTKANTSKATTLGVSYDGLEDAKQIDLALPGEESKLVWIATDLTQEEEELLVMTLKEYRDVFAWSYKDLKGTSKESTLTLVNTKFQ